jgi:hypothetical protein
MKKLNTSRLLAYYKAERNRMFNKGYRYMVIDEDDNCNPIMGWDNLSKSDTFNDDINFLNSIKAELDTREHVYKKNKYISSFSLLQSRT